MNAIQNSSSQSEIRNAVTSDEAPQCAEWPLLPCSGKGLLVDIGKVTPFSTRKLYDLLGLRASGGATITFQCCFLTNTIRGGQR